MVQYNFILFLLFCHILSLKITENLLLFPEIWPSYCSFSAAFGKRKSIEILESFISDKGLSNQNLKISFSCKAPQFSKGFILPISSCKIWTSNPFFQNHHKINHFISLRYLKIHNTFLQKQFFHFHGKKMLRTYSSNSRSDKDPNHTLKNNSSKVISGKINFTSNPDYLQYRLDIFNNLYSKQQEDLKKYEFDDIIIQIDNDKEFKGKRFQTTPFDILKGLSKNLQKTAIVAQILTIEQGNNIINTQIVSADSDDSSTDSNSALNQTNWITWDLNRPLEGSCKVKFFTFDDDVGKSTFWHSSAHILGQALERRYGGYLTIGPALTSGFYYDMYIGDKHLTQNDLEELNKIGEEIIQENLTFERLVCTKDDALKIFKDNPFKIQLIKSKIPDNGKTTCYRCGTLVDLCRGPHLISTSVIKSFHLTKHSSAYWLGNANLDSMQRIYGISFPTVKELEQYKLIMQKAKVNDHRVLGNSLNYFFFDSDYTPGSTFWLPYGARLYNKLCEFIRTEYRFRGFSEVITPNIYNCELWKVSGHYENYKENMYLFDIEEKEWGIKPMNCPGHCIMFKQMNPSYKQLPIRLADFGVLHRNELSGTISGLTRVRRFQQDDAHIFCRMDQLESEVVSALEFLEFIYSKMGFEFEIFLSTKPAKYMGEDALWESAENALKNALKVFDKKWELNPGDGAFYGPKIDIKLRDALRRSHQCGTIQIDFQLPIRFNLQFRTSEEVILKNEEQDDLQNANTEVNEDKSLNELKKGYDRPVIIHRAILGSIERMCGVLIEHTEGKLPFFLSPRQVIVLPVSDKFGLYARYVSRILEDYGYFSHVDESQSTLNKKIREAQILKWNFIIVVGEMEESKQTITVRSRENKNSQRELRLEDFLKELQTLNDQYSKSINKFIEWDKFRIDNCDSCQIGK